MSGASRIYKPFTSWLATFKRDDDDDNDDDDDGDVRKKWFAEMRGRYDFLNWLVRENLVFQRGFVAAFLASTLWTSLGFFLSFGLWCVRPPWIRQ